MEPDFHYCAHEGTLHESGLYYQILFIQHQFKYTETQKDVA